MQVQRRQGPTHILIKTVALAIATHQISIVFGGAYFNGRPPNIEHGERRLYVRIPKWLAALFSTYSFRGRWCSNLMLITGNAVRIKKYHFGEFLVGNTIHGLTKLYMERQV